MAKRKIGRQAALNANWRHFIVNKSPRSFRMEPNVYSGHKTKTCLYRKDGTANCEVRCGVGILIRDRDYRNGIEGSAADALPPSLGFAHDKEFFQNLQSAHDNAKTRADHRKRLRALAKHYSLRIPRDAA